MRVHGPVAALEWRKQPDGSMQAGSAMDGTFGARDVFGHAVAYSAQVTVRYTGPSVVSNPAPNARIETFNVSVPDTLINVAANSVASPPAIVTLTLEFIQSESALGVLPLTTSAAVMPCGGGFGSSMVSATEMTCVACLEGTYSEVTAYEACIPVEPCLEGSFDAAGSTGNKPQCICKAGFFFVKRPAPGSNLVECAECPPGGVCTEGLNPPYPAVGWYAASNGTFVRCKRPEACPGGVDVACAPGYTGYMCNACKKKYYSDSASKCVRCPPGSPGILVGGLLFVLAVAVGAAVVIGLGLMKAGSGGGGDDEGGETRESGSAKTIGQLRERKMPASVSMAVVAFQVLGVLADAKFSWGSRSKSMLRAFNAFNVDVNLFASECSLDSFHVKYAVSVLLPLVLLATAMAGLVVARVSFLAGALGGVSLATLLDAVLFSLGPLLYIPMSRATFVIFDCTRLPNGDVVLDVDPGVACFDSAWWSVMWVGLLGLGCYVVGLPAYCLAALWRNRSTLTDPVTFGRYGGLYRLFRAPYWFGGVADLCKRLAVVVAAVFVSDSQVLQVALLFAVLLMWLVGVARWRPYYFPLYNTIDMQLTLALLFVLLLGLASYAERNSSSSSSNALFGTVVLAVVALVALAAWGIVRDALEIFNARRGRYGTVHARARKLAHALELELDDLDIGPVERQAVVVAMASLRGGAVVEVDFEGAVADDDDGIVMDSMATPLSELDELASQSVASLP
ncbi:uncharacterized protein AMSG_11725 [Thecamonas trahens ATCC 50062]|uniref:Tyrosine-protein kinase ephrin type A/B receptor-like domain-containing protein n=1 Tax=Thecamonas trahens ATCC 50062 TaxID=461836 RepID=A0A0L0D8L1_THETB|nr:hypothetical protein AMSG_11725 [Thecamonas trahens ATCC 50062]KNC47623.1 hypothetical protein AMSG_11725 [Thecamonas trahens ATCC 50062]|eukprot:XP_013759569.1 hypothetical protein AMSG_11725 [Thecamonas trahens ATCC 50062]